MLFRSDVTSVLFTPDGSKIISAGEDKTIRIWDAHNHKLLITLTAHQETVQCLSLSPDGHHLASGSKEAICVWDMMPANKH